MAEREREKSDTESGGFYWNSTHSSEIFALTQRVLNEEHTTKRERMIMRVRE